MTERWYSEFHSAYAREIERLVAGWTLYIDDVTVRAVTVDRIKNVVVGIDSDGIFAAINVHDTDGGEWALYSDGTICAYDTDTEVGRHGLKTMPIVSEKVPT